MLKHKHSDIGVAVALPGGLITPIVRNCESKSLSTISNEMKDLAARARVRKLKPNEYQGGTSAVSNLGMYGIKDFTAVINPPHATILAVGAGEERAVVKNGKILLRARRSPGGDGRVYMIESKATDVAGNSATASATCVVPRHRNH